MGKWLSTLGIAAALAVFSASLAVAAPDDKKKAAKMPNCPACKMALVAKKDKTHTVAVKMKDGKTFYCCDKCPMAKPAGKKAK